MGVLSWEITSSSGSSSGAGGEAGDELEKADHAAAAVDRVLAQYRQLPRFLNLVRLQAGYVQDLEDAAFDFFEKVSLPGATGVTLDRLGAVVGQAREGRDDDTLRTWIAARVKLNRSSGTIPELLELLTALSPAGASVDLEESFPAGFRAEVLDVAVVTTLANQLARIVQLAKAAGVRAILVTSPAAPAGMFAFDGPGVGLGFGSTTDPLAGGVLAGARE